MDYLRFINECEIECQKYFECFDEIALYNQEKVLKAFQENNLALRHFAPSTGYGYSDSGREALNKIFSQVFDAEEAIVSPHIASGTHAISLALFGIARPGDVILSVTGTPYDTLNSVIKGKGTGNLRDYNINFNLVELIDNDFDYDNIEKQIKKYSPRIIYLQRSRGYTWRNSFSIADIKKAIDFVKKLLPNALIIVDNCYGEFVEKSEPTSIGADLIMGSLIKNPGGGLAPTGGYIAGKRELIELVGYRLTVPGIGTEIGSYNADYRYFFQGLFMAPHITMQALKASALFGAAFKKIGYETLPKMGESLNDIIRSIKFKTKDELIAFCRAIQKNSPIDSFAVPHPWDMPGYDNQIIMAAGTFVQGASIELSADAPIKEPYIAYMQGSLTYEHSKIALKNCLKSILCQTYND